MKTEPAPRITSFLIETSAIAAIAVVLAHLGSLLPLFPRTVTINSAVYGFAVAAVLVRDWRRALLGIWIGLWLANLWALADASIVTSLAASTIALASTAQSIAAALVIRRWITWLRELRTTSARRKLALSISHAAICALLTALACLIAPTLGVTTLWWLGRISSAASPAAWALWWMSGWAGVIVFAPALVALGRRLQQLSEAYAITLLAIDLGLVLSVGTFSAIRALESQRIAAEFAGRARSTEFEIRQSIDGVQHDLEVISALLVANPTVTREQFHTFVKPHLLGAHATPGTYMLAWAPIVPTNERLEFERAQLQGGPASAQIFERDAAGQIAPAGARAEYVAINFAEPLDVRHNTLGYDLLSDSGLRAALLLARATGQLIASAPAPFVGGAQPDLLLFWPVYQSAAPVTSVEQRQRANTGFVVGAYHIHELLEASLIGPDLDDIEVYLFDQRAPAGRQLLHHHAAQGDADSAAAQPEPSIVQNGLSLSASLDIGGHTWLMVARPAPAFAFSRRTWLPWAGLLTGLSITALVASFLAQRQRANQALQRSEQHFRALIEKSANAVTLVGADNQIHYHSPNYERVLGHAPETHIDSSMLDLIHPDDQSAAAALFQRVAAQPQQSQQIELRLCHADGSWRWLATTATNLLSDPAVGAVVVNFSDITERKRTEQELINLREAVKASSEAIFLTDRDGMFTWVNPAFSQLYGYTPIEVIGLHTPRLLKSGLTAKERYTTFWQAILEKRTVQDEIVNRTKDGRLVAIDRSVSPVLDAQGAIVAFLAIQRDISERKQADAREEQRHALLEQVLRMGKIISRRSEPQRCLEQIHARIQTELGFDRAALFHYDAANHLVRGAIATTRDGRAKDLSATVESDSQAPWPQVLRDPQGLYVTDDYTRDHALPPDHLLYGVGQRVVLAAWVGDQPIALIAVDNLISGRPITSEQIEALQIFAGYAGLAIENANWGASLERMVAERTADLSRANNDLTRALRTKDEFLANMSHELRTPLNGILALSESLEEQIRGPLNEHQLRWVKLIASSGQHLLSLITDILDLSKIEADRLEIQIEPVQVDEICQASLLFVKELALKKQLQVAYECNDTAAQLMVDPRRLKQILINLLSNAVKFTPAGGQVWLRVNADAAHEVMRFVVDDTGIGIAAADLPRLFQPFTQLDASLSREHEGSGLGLALVHRLTELHGGSVAVASPGVPGQGSSFSVALPWRRPAQPLASTLAVSDLFVSSLAAAPVQPQRTILLAEDNEINIHAVGDYLELLGYHVVVARTGAEALEQATQTQPDLILMDIQMPVMDGLEAMRRLRAQPAFRTTPMVALTALAMPGDRERCLAAGANAYLSKPVGLRSLAEMLGQLLDQSAQKSTA